MDAQRDDSEGTLKEGLGRAAGPRSTRHHVATLERIVPGFLERFNAWRAFCSCHIGKYWLE